MYNSSIILIQFSFKSSGDNIINPLIQQQQIYYIPPMPVYVPQVSYSPSVTMSSMDSTSYQGQEAVSQDSQTVLYQMPQITVPQSPMTSSLVYQIPQTDNVSI